MCKSYSVITKPLFINNWERRALDVNSHTKVNALPARWTHEEMVALILNHLESSDALLQPLEAVASIDSTWRDAIEASIGSILPAFCDGLAKIGRRSLGR